jgi:hypothetical protein
MLRHVTATRIYHQHHSRVLVLPYVDTGYVVVANDSLRLFQTTRRCGFLSLLLRIISDWPTSLLGIVSDYCDHPMDWNEITADTRVQHIQTFQLCSSGHYRFIQHSLTTCPLLIQIPPRASSGTRYHTRTPSRDSLVESTAVRSTKGRTTTRCRSKRQVQPTRTIIIVK